jgi:hypothetical protein
MKITGDCQKNDCAETMERHHFSPQHDELSYTLVYIVVICRKMTLEVKGIR